jgi:hypothetical protein
MDSVREGFILWVITRCREGEGQTTFRRNISAASVGLRESQARNQHEAGSKYRNPSEERKKPGRELAKQQVANISWLSVSCWFLA